EQKKDDYWVCRGGFGRVLFVDCLLERQDLYLFYPFFGLGNSLQGLVDQPGDFKRGLRGG
ncbi:MAG: hypothetical protein PHT99_03450, partial [Methanoregula sp.]|nr:hypothetical protein [Methanoregula sp.]